VTETNLVRFRVAVAGALAHLESRREELNDLNVFPVADGDTGDNMALTLRAVLDELDRLQGADERLTIDEIGREEIVQSVARAALLGARGNSGVILSQLIRGAAEELVSRPGQLIDATLIGAALAKAADRGYSSVREPVEGTILTVAREMAHKIVADVAHSLENPRLGPATERTEQDAAIADTLERALAAGQDSVRRGPELLAALRDAGVVDAGGYGLTIMFAGVVAALREEDPPALERHPPAQISYPEHSSSTYRFCTNFAVTGSRLNPSGFIAPLEELGDSVLVVGDARTLKVHLHTDEPELATGLFAGVGVLSRLDVADMRLQILEREERLAERSAAGEGETALAAAGESGRSESSAIAPLGVGWAGGAGGANGVCEHEYVGGARPRSDDARTDEGPSEQPHPAKRSRGKIRCGAVAVVSGEGMAEMFRELGVHPIAGGPTLNPSTYDLLAGIHEVPAEEIVVLTNNPNVLMAAEHAAKLSEKQVLVLPTSSQQAGLAGAVALMPDRSLQENGQALERALARVRTGAVAEAARDDPGGRFKRGQAVGFLEADMVAWGEPGATLQAVLRALADGAGRLPAGALDLDAPELISVLAGEGAPLGLDDVETIMSAELDGRLEFEVRDGGQPAYWWLLAAE
jgi:dihydroxyacetone kinase-like predicted kinase